MKSSLLLFLPALLRNEQSARHVREKARTCLDLALQKLKAWKEQGCTRSGLCYTVSHASVYLHRVLAEHQEGDLRQSPMVLGAAGVASGRC